MALITHPPTPRRTGPWPTRLDHCLQAIIDKVAGAGHNNKVNMHAIVHYYSYYHCCYSEKGVYVKCLVDGEKTC